MALSLGNATDKLARVARRLSPRSVRSLKQRVQAGGGSPGKGEEPEAAGEKAEGRASTFQHGAMSPGAGDPAVEGRDTVINAERQWAVAR
jgi:hypothetical protein